MFLLSVIIVLVVQQFPPIDWAIDSLSGTTSFPKLRGVIVTTTITIKIIIVIITTTTMTKVTTINNNKIIMTPRIIITIP